MQFNNSHINSLEFNVDPINLSFRIKYNEVQIKKFKRIMAVKLSESFSYHKENVYFS